MNKLLSALKGVADTMTENGAAAFSTTLSYCLDFFAQGGALRGQSEERIISLFIKAWVEDPLIALKTMFYFRDIRGGQGERRAFRIQLKYLATHYPEKIEHLIGLIPVYGRWDDLFSLFGTKLQRRAVQVIKDQVMQDIQNVNKNIPISLVAKWLPSEHTRQKAAKSEDKTGAEAYKYVILRNALELNSKQYRQEVSKLRKYLDLPEIKMASGRWTEINFRKVAGQCLIKSKNAFRKHAADNFKSYMEEVRAGKAKINTATIYPYQVVEQIIEKVYSGFTADEILEFDTIWQNLPDFTEGKYEDSIVVADVSGSMAGRPLEVCISLAIYFAERMNGPFKDHFITFSMHPTLQQVIGNNIVEKVKNLKKAHWDMNTNLEAVFDLILNIAIRDKLSPDDIVKKIYIISDMEFDQAATGRFNVTLDKESLMETINKKWQKHGYVMPKLVFWNVDAKNEQFPTQATDSNSQLVSGFSPSILKYLMTTHFPSAEELMLDVVNSNRYFNIRFLD